MVLMPGPCTLVDRTEAQTCAVPDRTADGTYVGTIAFDLKVTDILCWFLSSIQDGTS